MPHEFYAVDWLGEVEFFFFFGHGGGLGFVISGGGEVGWRSGGLFEGVP